MTCSPALAAIVTGVWSRLGTPEIEKLASVP